MWIDISLLVFNMLPIYPLDGGQILRSLLWFVLGRGRSLMVTTILGLVGIVGLIGVAVWSRSIWIGAVSAFMLMNCWNGLKNAQALIRIARLPRREGVYLSELPDSATVGSLLAMRRMQAALRHIRSPRDLSAL